MRTVVDIFRSHGVLDAQGRHVNGTDKETNHHYGMVYERLFACRWRGGRDEVKLMMEVGVADGSSLLAWREVFPNAMCVGFDIHPSEKAHGDRIEFHLGDATSQKDCERAVGSRLFDLIVDDASHLLPNTMATLFYLWPHVRTGGMYVIEEFPGCPCANITGLYPFAHIVDTVGPSGGIEPLVVLRKPVYGPSPLVGAYKEWKRQQ